MAGGLKNVALETERGTRIASLVAQCEKLERVNYPAQLKILGRKVYGVRVLDEVLGDLFVQLDDIVKEIEEKNRGSEAGQASLFNRAKAMAITGKMKIEAKVLESQRDGLFQQLGRLVVEQELCNDDVQQEFDDAIVVRDKIEALKGARKAEYLLDVQVAVVQKNNFGVSEAVHYKVAIKEIKDEQIVFDPDIDFPVIEQITSWWTDNDVLQVTKRLDDALALWTFTTPADIENTVLLDHIKEVLPDVCRSSSKLDEQVDRSGVFDLVVQDDETKGRLLEVNAGGGIRMPSEGICFREACVFTNEVVLSDGGGSFLRVRNPCENGSEVLTNHVAVMPAWEETAEAQRFIVLQENGECSQVCLMVVDADLNVTLGRGRLRFSMIESVVVENVNAQESHLVLRVKDVETPYVMLAASEFAYAFWKAWDMRSSAMQVASLDVAKLYSLRGQLRKYNLLLSLYGPILSLNHALKSGVSIDHLSTAVQEMGAVEFSENQEMREATIAKILMLTSALPKLKQNFELMSSLLPYYWVQMEAEWLKRAFGVNMTRKAIEAERKHIVPVVRREIRTILAGCQRPLAEMDAAMRPLEAILARDEVRQHWSSKTATFLPAVIQTGIGATMLVASGGTMGWHLVGGAIATSGLGGVLKYFQKDKEATAQIKRVAEKVFPWWEVFSRTLVVSVYESSVLIDGENSRMMKRDRGLLDQVLAPQKSGVVANLCDQLKDRIVEEKAVRFNKVMDGSGLRSLHLIDDLQQVVESGMECEVGRFVDEMEYAIH